jgi:hypothetical protein
MLRIAYASMSLTCFNCGKEMGDYQSDDVSLSLCEDCKGPPEFYRAARNPGKLLRDILLHGDYSDIIGIESDAGATRIYTASREAIDSGMVMMHYVRSEEVPWTDALRDRINWKPS